jgi:rhomboid protease GluP
LTLSDQPNQTPSPGQTPGQPQVLVPEERPAPPQIRLVLPDSKPVVTYTLIVITALIFFVQLGTQRLLGYDLPVAIGIKYNQLIDAGQYWRLIAPVLLHGDILHIGFNMYALHILGRELERFYGHARFLLLYLAGGFTGGVLSYLLTAAPSLGASTAVFGLLVAYGILGYRNKSIFGPQAQRIVRNVVQVAAINFLFGLSPGIDNWGHLGGAIGGFLIAWFGGPEYRYAGKMLEIHLEDKRSPLQFLAIFILVVGVFAAMALLIGGAA